MKKRPAIKGGFQIFVVPSDDVNLTPMSVPTPVFTIHPHLSFARVVAKANRNGHSCSPWAFTTKEREAVVKRLRDLADWIEQNPPIGHRPKKGKVKARYVSVWDGGVEVMSGCEYDPATKTVSDIGDTDVTGVEVKEDEYVELPDGTQLREKDGITFDY